MATRTELRAALRLRLGDPAPGDTWSDAALNSLLDYAVEGLYPSFYRRRTIYIAGTTGEFEALPAGVRNLYSVRVKREGGNQYRPLRGWTEDSVAGELFLGRHFPAGSNPIFSVNYTEGWTKPGNDSTNIPLHNEALEVVLLRAHIGAIESMLTGRVLHGEKYHAIQVRQQITEEEVLGTLEALHASLRERLDRAVPLPEVQN
jgi:hypothetical protein